MIIIIIQLGLLVYLYMSNDTPDNIDPMHAPIQFAFIIVTIIILVINVIIYDDNVLSFVMIILSLVISCTSIYYLRHMDKDYIAMNEQRNQSATMPQTTPTTFITNSMKSTFQHEKQIKNDIINTNANRYATLQQTIN